MVKFKYQTGGALTVVIAFLIGNSEVNYFFFHFIYVYLKYEFSILLLVQRYAKHMNSYLYGLLKGIDVLQKCFFYRIIIDYPAVMINIFSTFALVERKEA